MVRYVLIGGFVFTKMTVPLIMELNAAVATGNSWRVLTDARLVALAKALGPVRQR